MLTYLTRRLRAMRQDQEGQTLAEYALILAFIAVLAIGAVTFLGNEINAILSDVGNALDGTTP